jgi:hypothetical protein
MKRLACLFVAFIGALFATQANAQSGCSYIAYGAVLTAAQWNQCFANKLDYSGSPPITSIIGTSPITATAGASVVTVALNVGVNFNFTVAQTINLNAAALPASPTGTVLTLGNVDSTITRINAFAFGATPQFTGARADGTNASPTAVTAGDNLAAFNGHGYYGSGWSASAGASLELQANQTWSSSANGTRVQIKTTPNGSTVSSLAVVCQFENDAGVTCPNTVTGGDKGAGTINAAGLYVNGTAVSTGGASIASAAQYDITYYTGASALGGVAISGLVLASTSANPTAYGGTSCTNQFITALSAAGMATCNNVTNAYLSAGTFSNITGVGTLTAGATGSGFTVALSTSTITGTLGIGNGGTGAATQQAALNAIAPPPTRAGDVIYYNGTNWVALAGNNSGTQVLQENSSGVPSWAAGAGSGTVTSVATGGFLTGGPITTTGTVSSSFLGGSLATLVGAI